MPAGFESVVTALCDLGITRLLVPDTIPESGNASREDRAVLRERIKKVVV